MCCDVLNNILSQSTVCPIYAPSAPQRPDQQLSTFILCPYVQATHVEVIMQKTGINQNKPPSPENQSLCISV